jgi:hypothetical protein
VTNVFDEMIEKAQHICQLSLNMEFENLYNADGLDFNKTHGQGISFHSNQNYFIDN